ncbi:MAG TPA: hypothetical protein VJ526_08300, partial [Beijerinckiaceae bacterium]|nr:hypothetical protein [Beijerinckiaceae bacterium]
RMLVRQRTSRSRQEHSSGEGPSAPTHRARAGFPIAAPVTWEHVEKGVAPDAFTLDRPTLRSKTR